MSRVSVTEDDKQRVLDIQKEMNIDTQHATMQMLLDAADTAIALADLLECQPEELIDKIEQQRQRDQALQAKLTEAEKMVNAVGENTGTSKVIEQSLAMANRFNHHLEQENERLRGRLATATQETESLRSQLERFEASQQQLQQLQQLLNGGGLAAPATTPTSGSATTAQRTYATRQPVAAPTVAVSAEPARMVETAAVAQPEGKNESYSDQADREVANLIHEIIQYNDQQATDDSERWLINQSTLKQLTTRNQAIIKRVIEDDEIAQAISNERVDDIPLLLSQMQKVGLSELVDEHFEPHGNWKGLSLGKVVMGWLSYILSQGDHRLNQVESWASGLSHTLAT